MNTPAALAHRVDYRRLATQQGRVEGEIEIAALPRVAAEMADDQRMRDAVVVDLVFTEDMQRRVRVRGEVRATLRLECQRCLQVFDHAMDIDVAGVVVGDDESAANVPREDEPVMADGDMLDVHALVADELLLALPPVARCEQATCTSRYAAQPEAAVTPQSNERRTDNPFAVLDQLKRDD